MKRVLRAARRPVARALARRRFVRSLRPDDHFVATYPKSGTNWVGFFLACALLKDEPAEVRDSVDLVSYRKWVPDINQKYSSRTPLAEEAGLPSPRFMTLHSAHDPALARVVNVIRDPRDVMVSYYYQFRRHQASFEMPIHDFVEANRMPPGDWGEHVRGWLAAADTGRVHVVRYEDLKADPEAGFAEMAHFCGLDLSPDELGDCVRRASFKNMQKKERWDVGKRKRPIAFIRKGKAGGWKEELEERTVALIEARYRDLMLELGYEPSQ